MFEPATFSRGDVESIRHQHEVSESRVFHDAPWSSGGFFQRILQGLAKRFVCPNCAVRRVGCPH